MRVLVVLNENPLGSHPDIYEAFDNLVVSGLLKSYDVYPYFHARQDGATDAQIAVDLLALARQGGHGLII